MYQPSYPAQSSSSSYFTSPGTVKHVDEPQTSPSVLKTKRKRQSVDLSTMHVKQIRVRSPPPQCDSVPGLMRDEGHSNSCSDEDMEPELGSARGNTQDSHVVMMELDDEQGTWRPREEATRDLGARQPSPWSAQPFTTSLHPPAPRVGLLQPTMHTAQPLNSNDALAQVEAARRVHGPQCTTIPRLRLSDHPDPITGQRSMWSYCADCGGCERV